MIGPQTPKRQTTNGNSAAHIPRGPYYAKTYQADHKTECGRTVLSHCQIVGEVARELIRRIPCLLSCLDPPESAALVAAAHDTGKICPTFQKKILANTSDYRPADYPWLVDANPSLEKNWGGHAGVSQLTLDAAGAGKFIPEIVGQHHGYSPPVQLYRADHEVFGGPAWQKERIRLLTELRSTFNSDWPDVDGPENARLLAGLTSVADWIGSGELFDDPESPWKDVISRAVDMAGFLPVRVRQGLSFSDVFGKEYVPYPVQQQFIEAANTPGVYVLEAPMGMGKTEAALFAAYQLISNGFAHGIYFALPTQLTSNRIYVRFKKFLARILETDSPGNNILLLHGRAWLKATELGADGGPGSSWFNTRKRGLLAPFAVGTLDQALMAAMNVKHGFVRAFGLAGKVVILDEVHSYDAYTGIIIDALIALLTKLNTTVFILSATLTRERRTDLIAAELEQNAFPLITAQHKNGRTLEIPAAIPTNAHRQFYVTIEENDQTAVTEVLDRACLGEQVLWIENTVSEAQERYLDIAARCAELNIECGLLHSRFIMEHRRNIEQHWVSLYGREGWQLRGIQGRILVGTQVLEQSLDIDADFLVTRFCPSDMLLQRIGRVWRHADTPRAQSAEPSVMILAPELDRAVEKPLKEFGPTAFVYDPYILCRSLEVWSKLRHINLPSEIRQIMDWTYAKRKEKGKMEQWLYELENGTSHRIGRRALRQLARITLSRSGKTLPEAKAQTRYGQEPHCEVLMVSNIRMNPETRETSITLLNHSQVTIPWDKSVLNRTQWKEISAVLMAQVVNVRTHEAPLPLSMDVLRKLHLENCLYLGNPAMEEALLRLAIVEKDGMIKAYQDAPLHEHYRLMYRDDIGYRTVKMEQKK